MQVSASGKNILMLGDRVYVCACIHSQHRQCPYVTACAYCIGASPGHCSSTLSPWLCRRHPLHWCVPGAATH